MSALETIGMLGLGYVTGRYILPVVLPWIEKPFRYIFGLAKWLWFNHLSPAAGTAGPTSPVAPSGVSSTVKEEPMQSPNTADAVAHLLSGATAAAEAATDCGAITDDTELVANFIAAMDDLHSRFVQGCTKARTDALAQGVPEDQLNDVHTSMVAAMMNSPAGSNAYFFWRMADYLKRCASPDVVAAAREVVAKERVYFDAVQDTVGACREVNEGGRREPYEALMSAIAKLAASLPKEG